MTPVPERYLAGEARIYRIPLDLFPGLSGYAHVVAAPGVLALVDVGSGLGDSDEQLDEGLRAIRRDHGEDCAWDRLTHVVISHGHIDHYGGLPFVRQRTSAPVGIHRLDRPVLTRFERSLETMAVRLRRFLTAAGVGPDERDDLMDLYLAAKSLFASQAVDFNLDSGGPPLGPVRVLHTPGHCPGQVVMRVGDLLLTSDHVLPDITPHMAPASLSKHTGLDLYLESLGRLERWAPQTAIGLGGHGGPIPDVHRRIADIRAHHEQRLERLLAALEQPRTTAELADVLFPQAKGYHRLLALEEVGAHIEYLEARQRIVRRGAVRAELIRTDPPPGDAPRPARARLGRASS